MDEFLETIGPEAGERPSPTVKGSVAAAAAVLAWLGTTIIAIDNLEPGSTNMVGVGLGLVGVVVGHAIVASLAPSVRPAGIALIALGTASTVVWVFDDLDTPTAALFLLAGIYALQWARGPARGATALLALALLAAWGFVIDLAAGDPEPADPFASDPFGTDDPFAGVPETSFTSGDDTASYLSLLIGAALLVAVRALDRRGWHGVATAAVIVGDIAFVVGVFGVIGTLESDEAGSLLVLTAGVVLAVCAVPGERRLTAWLGGIGVFAGLLSLLISVMEPDRAVQFGVVCIIIGAVVVAGAAFLDLDALRANQPAAAGTASTGPPAVEAGWYRDPTGGHELRYHDGTSWTNHVSDGGTPSTDGGV